MRPAFASLFFLVAVTATASFAAETAGPGAPADAAPLKPNQAGAGDLLITPARVVLGGRKRIENVLLNNRGEKPATYRITLERMHALENGGYQKIDDAHPARPDEKFADEVIRYSPRQVTLAANESQTVKFMLRFPDGAAEGEYRSHILFQAVPEESRGADLEKTAGDDKQVSVKLTPIYGLSIPLIARNGELTATVTITDAVLQGKDVLLTLNREGGRSVFGDLVVTDAAGATVGQLKGVSVFAPNSKRTAKITLAAPNPGPLTVTYNAREDDGSRSGKGTPIAEAPVKTSAAP